METYTPSDIRSIVVLNTEKLKSICIISCVFNSYLPEKKRLKKIDNTQTQKQETKGINQFL